MPQPRTSFVGTSGIQNLVRTREGRVDKFPHQGSPGHWVLLLPTWLLPLPLPEPGAAARTREAPSPGPPLSGAADLGTLQSVGVRRGLRDPSSAGPGACA